MKKFKLETEVQPTRIRTDLFEEPPARSKGNVSREAFSLAWRKLGEVARGNKPITMDTKAAMKTVDRYVKQQAAEVRRKAREIKQRKAKGKD